MEVENRDKGDLIQSSTKGEVKSMEAKKNLGRFKLSYLFLQLESDMHSQIGTSGKDILLNDILNHQMNLGEFDD